MIKKPKIGIKHLVRKGENNNNSLYVRLSYKGTNTVFTSPYMQFVDREFFDKDPHKFIEIIEPYDRLIFESIRNILEKEKEDIKATDFSRAEIYFVDTFDMFEAFSAKALFNILGNLNCHETANLFFPEFRGRNYFKSIDLINKNDQRLKVIKELNERVYRNLCKEIDDELGDFILYLKNKKSNLPKYKFLSIAELIDQGDFLKLKKGSEFSKFIKQPGLNNML
jgi:hypothetical protein